MLQPNTPLPIQNYRSNNSFDSIHSNAHNSHPLNPTEMQPASFIEMYQPSVEYIKDEIINENLFRLGRGSINQSKAMKVEMEINEVGRGRRGRRGGRRGRSLASKSRRRRSRARKRRARSRKRRSLGSRTRVGGGGACCCPSNDDSFDDVHYQNNTYNEVNYANGPSDESYYQDNVSNNVYYEGNSYAQPFQPYNHYSANYNNNDYSAHYNDAYLQNQAFQPDNGY